ncbi:MAG: hypothetical protein M3P53_08535, partial [Actinomycetota bacterium]|nr:hypothetical protein [Actinomycetota bacterium]
MLDVVGGHELEAQAHAGHRHHHRLRLGLRLRAVEAPDRRLPTAGQRPRLAVDQSAQGLGGADELVAVASLGHRQPPAGVLDGLPGTDPHRRGRAHGGQPADFGVGAHQPRRGQVVHPHRGDSHVDAGSAEHDHRPLLGLVPGGQVERSRRGPRLLRRAHLDAGGAWRALGHVAHHLVPGADRLRGDRLVEGAGGGRRERPGQPGWRATSRTRSPSAPSHPRPVVRTCQETPTASARAAIRARSASRPTD